MIACTDLILNNITYCKKGDNVQVLKKESKHTMFQNETKTKFKVSNELVPLYFSEVIKCK